MLTAAMIAAAGRCPLGRAAVWLEPLAEASAEFEIITAPRLNAFLAQIAHESAGFSRLDENLNYSAEGLLAIWPRHFTQAEAQDYARQPLRIANRAYANRLGNGNEASGDGWRYRGRGLIQLTGRRNYELCGDGLRLDLVGSPDLLLQPRVACRSAAWYWAVNGLNALADSDRFVDITRRINGGNHGLKDRVARWEACKRAQERDYDALGYSAD